MLLPHGMEGQGPEHSSARLERFLNMCVNDNIQVCNVTTPAQIFHLLRRQVMRPYRKPLIVMSPKSLLRHPAAVSPLEEFTRGRVPARHPRRRRSTPRQVDRVLLCSGKVYYDLAAAREVHELKNVAIIRVEQLYPLRREEILEALSVYPEGIRVIWVQEEARNMGAWHLHEPRVAARCCCQLVQVVGGQPAAVGQPGHRFALAPQPGACEADRGGDGRRPRGPSSSTKDRSRRVPPS